MAKEGSFQGLLTGSATTSESTSRSGDAVWADRPVDPSTHAGQTAPHEGLLVETLDRLFGQSAVGVFDECEPAGTSRVSIDGNYDVRRVTDGREVRPEVGFGRAIRHVAYEQTYSH